MKTLRIGCVFCGFLFLVLLMSAQTSVSNLASAQVPPLIQFSNVASDEGGNPLSGAISITFLLYNGQQGGEPLWTETQNNVQLDATGHYSVQLGITKAAGVPATLFTSGEARWLGVRIGEQAEQPRVVLLSVPYALKAGDATTIGGLPPSAFVLAATATGSVGAAVANSVAAPSAAPPLNGGGTKNHVPLWLSSSKLGDSKLFQSTAGNVGVGTTTPIATLDVNGAVNAATSYDLGGTAFAYGSFATGNALLGFAGNSTMTGHSNTATGLVALVSNTTGAGNTATGATALQFNTTGSDNAAHGSGALGFNTTGSENTASGFGALSNNVSGGNNTASGGLALFVNTTGSGNTANGADALEENSTGSGNTANGYEALFFNTASDNTANGFVALFSNSTGTFNSANGYEALYSNTTASLNTADGVAALYGNTTGSTNTAIGFGALDSNTTGNNNTAVGGFALAGNATGFAVTCVGYLCNAGAANLTDATAVGAYATVNLSNALVLGSTSSQNGLANVLVGIDVSSPSNILTVLKGGGHAIADGWDTYSSRRWKTNIQPLHSALGIVEQLRGVSYDLKDSGKHEIGVIAEEVGEVVPEVVSYEENGKDARGVDYSRLTALLIEATKEQQALIRHQQKLIRAQQTQLRSQQEQIRMVQDQNTAQQAQISQLVLQVQTIQVSLSSGRPAGFEVRTASVRTTARR